MTLFPPRHTIAVVPNPTGARLLGFRRAQDALQCTHSVQATFDPSGPDNEIGGAIRTALRSATMAGSAALLCVPPDWCTTRRLTIPESAGQHRDDFLHLQAEAHLSPGTDALAVASSEQASGERGTPALLVALPSQRLNTWRARLEAAGLRLTAACPAIIPIAEAAAGPQATLVLHHTHAYLQITSAQALICWKRLRLGPSEATPEARLAALVQDLRISLAELDDETASHIGEVAVLGDSSAAPILERIEAEVTPSASSFAWGAVEPRSDVADMLARGAARVSGTHPTLVFRDRTVRNRPAEARRRAVLLGGIAVAAVILFEGGYCLLQTRQLSRLRRISANMAADVGRAAALRQAVQQLEPWYDRHPFTLDILRDIAMAFPENGSVTVSHLTINGSTMISLAGEADSAGSWLTMQEALRACPRVANLAVAQTRTASRSAAITFSLEFSWNARGRSS